MYDVLQNCWQEKLWKLREIQGPQEIAESWDEPLSENADNNTNDIEQRALTRQRTKLFSFEREYWQALKSWPMNTAGTTGVIFPCGATNRPEDISLAVMRKMLTVFLFNEFVEEV